MVNTGCGLSSKKGLPLKKGVGLGLGKKECGKRKNGNERMAADKRPKKKRCAGSRKVRKAGNK